METKIVKVLDYRDPALKEAGAYIKEGKLVAFPTETVYGLGADGLNQEAVENIFRAKGRPSDNPLILHISNRYMLESLVSEIPEEAEKIMKEFWPGPITLIFKRSKIVPDIITAGLDTVAIRMPSSELARSLIELSDTPIAAPSANSSGRPSPTSADHVYQDLKSRVDLIVDGGDTGIGLESTVVDVSGDFPMILRPGGITLEDLRKIDPRTKEDLAIVKKDLVPKSPGQKYRHYAPKADMYLYRGDLGPMTKGIIRDLEFYKGQGLKVGVISTDESLELYKTDFKLSLGKREDLEEVGHNLFSVLRQFDDLDVDIILSESFPYKGLGKAIMNRMEKASGGKLVEES